VDAGFLCIKAAVICAKIKERLCTMLILQRTMITFIGIRKLAMGRQAGSIMCVLKTFTLLGAYFICCVRISFRFTLKDTSL
jgi:hypothetical protein